jgi:hypothetical protein
LVLSQTGKITLLYYQLVKELTEQELLSTIELAILTGRMVSNEPLPLKVLGKYN